MVENAHQDVDLGDDLFDFDELLRDLPQLDEDELGAAFDAVSEVTAAAPEFEAADADLFAEVTIEPEPEPAAPLPAPTHRVQPKPPPLGSVKRQPAAAAAAAPAAQPARAATPQAPSSEPEPDAPLPAAASTTTTVLQRISFSPALAVVLVLITVLNLGLVGFVVRALTAVQSTVVDMGHEVIRSAEAVRDEASTLAADHAADALPIVSERPEGLTALERARTQFASGAFESGRQTLYSLLAVIDRVPAAVRVDVEARARFLLADSWRLEAEALDHGGMRTAEVVR